MCPGFGGNIRTDVLSVVHSWLCVIYFPLSSVLFCVMLHIHTGYSSYTQSPDLLQWNCNKAANMDEF